MIITYIISSCCLDVSNKIIYKIFSSLKIDEYVYEIFFCALNLSLYFFFSILDEELDSVSKDLQKCEHPLPMFQKIGGILSKNNVDDGQAMHKALVELNKLLDGPKPITSALLNPQLKLKYVQNRLMEDYKKVLKAARHEKLQTAHNHSLNESYVPDEYDELLTIVDIQGHITATNYKYLWKSYAQL